MEVEVVSIMADKIGYISTRAEHRSESFEDDLLELETPKGTPEEFEPIPLDKEQLEKCGFHDTSNGCKSEYKKDGFVIKKEGGNGTWVFMILQQAASYNAVKYLHQLQNLYFAHNSHELEISL